MSTIISLNIKASLVAMLLTTVIFIIHIIPANNSMLNYHDVQFNKETSLIHHNYLNHAIGYHKTEPSFARRPILTLLITTASSVFNTKTSKSSHLSNNTTGYILE